jgi:hypothetical protein
VPREKIIPLIQLILALTGLIVGLVARFFRAPGQPFVSFNPKYWMPVWTMKDKYRGPGYALSLIATLIIVIAAVWALAR